jgi:hypothetical protein
MKTPLAIAAALLASACATTGNRSTSRFDDLDDAEIARIAVHEALGELHTVEAIDQDSGEVQLGVPAFASHDERVAFEARLDKAIRSRLTGQAPVLDQLADRCEYQQKKGFEVWPREQFKQRAECSWADASVTIHSLWKKPRLHLVYLNTLLDVVGDPEFAIRSLDQFDALSKRPREGYVFKIGASDYLEGFRPRG